MLAFKVLRGGVAVFILSMLWQAAQTASHLPVAAEAEAPTVASVLTAPLAPTISTPVWPLAPIRIEWFTSCDPAQTQLGLYAPTDGACSPSRTATLDWLQSELKAIGLLSGDEVLQRAENAEHPACGALVLGGSAPASWLCADGSGLYRLEAPETRWQLQLNGAWEKKYHE
jgi:hypothetical protein